MCNFRKSGSRKDLQKNRQLSNSASNMSSHRSRNSRINLNCTTSEIINKFDISACHNIRKDFIMTRHIYIIVWSVILLALYNIIYMSPILYVVVHRHLSYRQGEIFREFCILVGTFGTVVNSTMFAMPLMKGKLRSSFNKIKTRRWPQIGTGPFSPVNRTNSTLEIGPTATVNR